MSPATVGALIGAFAGGLLAFVAAYFLRRREEAMTGGAAERRLQAELVNALQVLEVSHGRVTAAWTKPGLRVKMSPDQWDRLVARFPHLDAWNRFNEAAEALDILQSWAESKHADSPDPAEIEDCKTTVSSALGELNKRQSRWMRWRPWIKRPEGHRGGVKAWTQLLGVVAIGLAIAGLAGWLVANTLHNPDPLTAKTVEAKLREEKPNARFVHCTGSDTRDHWRCIVVSGGCTRAALAPGDCAPPQRQETDDVEGNWRDRQAYSELLALKTASAKSSAAKKNYRKRLRAEIIPLGN